MCSKTVISYRCVYEKVIPLNYVGNYDWTCNCGGIYFLSDWENSSKFSVMLLRSTMIISNREKVLVQPAGARVEDQAVIEAAFLFVLMGQFSNT